MNNDEDIRLKALHKTVGLAKQAAFGDVEGVILMTLAIGVGRRASRVLVARLLVAPPTCATTAGTFYLHLFATA